MMIYLLYTGEYDGRSIHSAHSTREAAVAVDARVRRDWHWQEGRPADIEEVEVDANLCSVCGYDEDLHRKHPDTWTHPFQSTSSVAGT